MTDDLKVPPLQMLYELRHPDRQRIGWEDNAALMADAADRIEALEAERGQYRDMAHRSESAWHEACARAEAAETKLQMAVEALEPFAAVDPIHVTQTDENDDAETIILTENQFRNARSTLQAIRGRHHG